MIFKKMLLLKLFISVWNQLQMFNWKEYNYDLVWCVNAYNVQFVNNLKLTHFRSGVVHFKQGKYIFQGPCPTGLVG